MKVTFADSFWDSLKVMSRHQTWLYKTYAVFRYKIPMFIENLWFFRKELWEFRSWDYSYNLSLLKRSLEKTCHTLEFYGMEVEYSRMKKVNKIKRAIQIIESINAKTINIKKITIIDSCFVKNIVNENIICILCMNNNTIININNENYELFSDSILIIPSNSS